MKTNTYQTEKTKLYTLRLRAQLKLLPEFCKTFFRGIEQTTGILTRYGYAVDLHSFFEFLIHENPSLKDREIIGLSPADLDDLHQTDIEAFLSNISYYFKDEREYMNGDYAKARKLSAIRALFKYLFRHDLLTSNIAELVDTPKLHAKAIIRLEPNEVADLLDLAEKGDGLTERQKIYHQITRVRDVAILTLFLGTGIRISELVGIDVGDIDLENDSFIVTRKGGYQDVLNFGAEVHQALSDYFQQRKSMIPSQGHEKALFLSMQDKRVSVRAVENLVVKYSKIAAPLKKITPHKLRSTYGTMLYHETQDIYLVADVLGHKDVNTTRKHYAASSEENKRIAAKRIKLRDD